ncbi:hypothetical protein LTR70_007777 [Exophiala xenobiotica]|uniref:Uncharacterized protein n=1 Tax=Lithohypha guttulata TaxID=1690604 RepID=A0ABR0K4N7_9EURO|nr:hypothetical protein LTR24_007442 [Lithohypha guttulata]KAK5313159.1 hypothetical protein LTR70_007777 [Exophiala xenobiotica]
MSDYEGGWPEQEAEERQQVTSNTAYTDHATAHGNSDYSRPGPPMAIASMTMRERVASPPEAQLLLTSEAMRQEAEERQRAEDKEHQRITNTRFVGFMVAHGGDGLAPGSSVSNRLAQANQVVASVNIDLAREVVRLEGEIAQLHQRNAILQTKNKALESHITAIPTQIEASTSVAAEAGSTVGARSDDGAEKDRANAIDVESTSTNEKGEKDESELGEKEQ